MLLSDTLCYACDTIKPDILIDSATLPGAMCVATGWACAGCFTWSKDLANQLIAAGEQTGDRIWRMPVFKSHKSKIAPAQLADINNTGPRNCFVFLNFTIFDFFFFAQLSEIPQKLFARILNTVALILKTQISILWRILY